jgi:hypothetical protein
MFTSGRPRPDFLTLVTIVGSTWFDVVAEAYTFDAALANDFVTFRIAPGGRPSPAWFRFRFAGARIGYRPAFWGPPAVGFWQEAAT